MEEVPQPVGFADFDFGFLGWVEDGFGERLFGHRVRSAEAGSSLGGDASVGVVVSGVEGAWCIGEGRGLLGRDEQGG